MSSDEWELLSPRYFSDILVPLFNGGLIAYAVIFVLLFFGTIIMPIIVKLIRKQATQRYANNSSQVDSNHKKTLLTLTDIPQYLPDDRWSYRLFYYTSLGLGVLYFSFHIAISVWPTTILTTGGKLQLLTADDIEAMIQFLYRWILTGYALVVFSISLGLDFVARWMAVSWPKEKQPDTGPQEPVAHPPSPPTPASSTSLPMGQTSLKNVITSIKQSSFLVEIRIEKSNHRKKGEDKLMHDSSRAVCVSTKGQIEYEDEWPTGDEMQRLLRFRSNDGMWCVAYVESPLVGTSVKYLKGGRGRWQLLTNEMPINDEIIKFQWGIDGVRYYCECTRYVKL